MKTLKHLLRYSILIIFAFIQLYPLIWLLSMSLKTNEEIFAGNAFALPNRFIIENYRIAWTDSGIAHYFGNSLFLAIATVLLSGLLASMLAYAITRMRMKSGRSIYIFFALGLMIPIHVVIIPLFLILRSLGILNTPLALLIPYVAFNLPFSVLILSSFFRTIPYAMEEASLMEGAGPFQTFFLIMIPLIKSPLATISIFNFLASWNEYIFAVTFINNSEFKTLTIGLMKFVGMYQRDWAIAGAAMMIASLPVLLVYIILREQVQESFKAGAILK